ncbi:MAG: tetratricopeptide repeat protein [Aphanocapsa sp. GSE-SYN-MK-11-07L]|nr:tetratricopeptide repeat protein [Aphanocapsa sp. GSE-SYN-MK-11-07L]
MNDHHFERSQLLVNQGRYELAEQELAKVLAANPDHASAHALLAICLAQKEQLAAATQTIQQAIALSPQFSGFHYIYAGILSQQGKLTEAKAAIAQALRLDPKDADYYARLASIQYDQTKYTEVLQTTKQGLSLDPEHIGCMNLRLLGLMQLGQLASAEQEVAIALAHAPNNSFSYGIQGWILLHQNRIPEALHSFRAALRLEPQFEWARQGLVEGLKARNVLYRTILRFDLWRSRMNNAQRVGLVLLLLIPQTRFLVLLLFLCILLIRPLFTALLCLDPYGRLALTRQEINRSKWISTIILSFIPGAIAALISHQVGWIFILPSLLAVAYWAVQLRTPESNREQKLKLVILLLLGIGIALLAIAAVSGPANLPTVLASLGAGLILVTVLGFLFFVVGAFIIKSAIALYKQLTKNRKV